MKKEKLCKIEKLTASDPVYYYIFFTAVILFLYVSFPKYTQGLYEQFLFIPCCLFWGTALERRAGRSCRNVLVLPGIMAVWFLILQIRRFIVVDHLYSIELFLSTYLFAFPLASLLKDGNRKNALKIFAGAYLASAAVLATMSMLLVFDCLPAALSKFVLWDGARLEVFWHPNIAACFFMIGVVFCTTFFTQTKSLWVKIGLCLLIIMITAALALTNCRTAIILTGGYFGALAFFVLIKRGWKWIPVSLFAVVILTAGFYSGAGRLYQLNQDRLIANYTRMHSEWLLSELANPPSADTAESVDADIISAESDVAMKPTVIPEQTVTEPQSESDAVADRESQENYTAPEDFAIIETEPVSISVNSETGEVTLASSSPQKSLATDLGTLNSRTKIWGAALYALRESRPLLFWGIGKPGEYVSYYFYTPLPHTHNAWMECLVGMGLMGFLIAMAFTLITLWNILIVLVKHHQDHWKRNIALLTMCLMAAALLEPYLFYTAIAYHPIDFLFFLCAGYLANWQETDNRAVMDKVRRILSIKK